LIFSNLQIAKARSKDRSLRQLLQIFRYLCAPKCQSNQSRLVSLRTRYTDQPLVRLVALALL
jgi:hypothetical protein